MSKTPTRVVAGGFLALLLLMLTAMPAEAAKWWVPNQLTWTADHACRDGVVLQARDFFPGNENGHEYPFEAWFYEGSFEEYPTLAVEYESVLYPTIDMGKLTEKVGAYTIIKQPLHSAPLIYDDDGKAKFGFSYDVANLMWDAEQPVGTIVSVAWTLGGEHIVLQVEDCFLSADADGHTTVLTLAATVGTVSDACADRSVLTVDPGDEVFACLLLENGGDAVFTGHELTADSYAMDTSVDFLLTPGTRISVTHDLADAAGLNLNLGPFTDRLDVANTLTWTASGESGSDTERAQTVVIRDSVGRLFLPAISK